MSNNKNIVKKSVKTKKQKIVGKETYINQTTGEIKEMVVIDKYVEQDFNFHKIWLTDLLNIIEIIGTKKLKIVKYILNKMNTKDNTIYFTQRGLSKELGISLQTINDTIKILIETNFMKKVQNGVYQINPDIIIKGNSGKRVNLLIQYKNIDNKNNKEGK